jgi:radical SAM superfamily enzyme YgiQ (UPF0313 family)|tara:strand:+ start:12506 stop:13726 length:1221 start_codon:yes stop_codon:yes gene_type:complete
MKVCLINPSDTNDEDPCWDEPLGLLYLGTVLNNSGIEVEIIDMNFHYNFAILSSKYDVDYFGIYCSSATLSSVLKINKYLRDRYPNAIHIVGGPHATCVPQSLTAVFDKVVVGEGEEAILKIIGGCTEEVVSCGDVDNIDDILIPDRDLLRGYQYNRKIDGVDSWGIITSRGCPFNCAFCSKVWGKHVRFRSPENVLEEVSLYVKKYGIKAIWVRDDTFTLDKKRMLKIIEGFKELGVTWRCLTRVDRVDEDILNSMADSGCKEIVYGIESGNDEILKNLRKGTTVEQNARAIDLTMGAGIHCKTAVIIGSPGETWDTINDTIELIDKHRPDRGIICMFSPFPGSAVWERPEEFDLKVLTDDLDEYCTVGPGMTGNVVVETKQMSKDDLKKAHGLVLSKFKEWGLV